MADFVLLGLFDNVENTADALDDLAALGVEQRQIEILSNVPYPARVFGHKPARLWILPWVLMGALGGAAIAFFITVITPLIYPIKVGFQPIIFPFPPSAIMFFEFTALGTMVMAFIGFVVQNRFPAIARRMYDERITEGYIGVEVRVPQSQVDRTAQIFEQHRAKAIKREDAAAFPTPGRRQWALYLGVLMVLGIVGLVPLLFSYDLVDVPWINVLADTQVTGFQEGPRRAAPAEAVPVQGPVLIAGQPATAPLPASDLSIQRGETLFNINCDMCHGPGGRLGEAPLAKYFPEAADLTSDRVQSKSPEEIFLVITNGHNRMPSLRENVTPGETWDIVNYVLFLGPPGG